MTDEIHARIEFTANERGEVEVNIEAVNDMSNPAVHFAVWIKDNIAKLGEQARRDYDRLHKPKIILETKKRLRGADGKAMH